MSCGWKPLVPLKVNTDKKQSANYLADLSQLTWLMFKNVHLPLILAILTV